MFYAVFLVAKRILQERGHVDAVTEDMFPKNSSITLRHFKPYLIKALRELVAIHVKTCVLYSLVRFHFCKVLSYKVKSATAATRELLYM